MLTRRAPRERQLGVDPVTMKQPHVVDDRLAVALTAECPLHAVDAEPAVLVEQQTDEVDVPRRDRPD